MESACRYVLSCCWIMPFLLGSASSATVEATVGTDVTLTCRYDAKYYGPLASCWGRGAVPTRGCASELISSDGTSVTGRVSERYMLTGDLSQGDASLTVRQAQQSDSGTYGCRVHVPGLFNDLKHELTLVVVPARPKPIVIAIREVGERTIALRWTASFDGGSPIRGYDIEYKSRYAGWNTAVSNRGLNPKLTEATLVDLHPFTSYNVRIFARNSVGLSEPSNILAVTTKEAAPSGPPLDLQLQALSPRKIKATWRPPRLDLRNGMITQYVFGYRWVDQASGLYTRWYYREVTVTGEQETTLLDHLKPSTKYAVSVMARNVGGLGPSSYTELSSTLDEEHTTSTVESTSVDAQTMWYRSTTDTSLVVPEPPVLELVEVRDGAVSIRWTSGFDGGSPITSYDLEYKAQNDSWDSTKKAGDFSANWTETTIIERHASTYNIRLFARNRLGISVASNELTVTTGEEGQGDFSMTTISPLHTVSSDTQAVSADERGGGHVAATVVPVLLLVLLVGTAVMWQLRRIKLKKGSLGISWLNDGSLLYRGTEPSSEL